ncbi:restriction endonuclease subunit S [Lactobacillus amylovorus]|uniref:restriction endonuclease subunit S n=1 Tax=Lactobacillus amylovorus TaxID=1604 RepID=UPI00232B42A0|nr:restriction endonuclease subunit S [Lactobacillus amylovorus]MDB6253485.1 restriction endonuclease subunit S [Lactobacillus amylovorus]
MTPEQLRTSILQYAMEGKLVKQDSNDEPASELVKRSQDKKIELIKNGELKKSKKLPVITDGEKPFNIPDNWAWSRLGDLFTILRGGSPRPIKSFLTNDENGINWIKIGDTDPNSKYITKTEEKIIPEGLKKSRAVHIGDFVLSNSMSFGRPYILKINGAVHDGWLIISDYDQVFNKDFLYYLLLSSFVKKQFSIAATGSTVKNLNRERVANTIGVIPPLEEQKRIVAKIEKLMPLVDEYAESYNRLQKIDNEFEDKLKQSVLQYAMEGKLVKQDPSDEPASELIKKIENEKAELIKEGKIKKNKKLPAITDDEKPFDIPDSWEWVRLGNIGDWGAGATPSRQHPEYYGGDVLWLKTGDLNDGVIQDTSEKITEAGVANSSVKVNQPGNILIAMYGATIGKLGIVGKTLVTNQACCGCTPFKGIYNLYLFYYLLSARNRLIELGSGGAQPNISKTKIENFIFPLPPLEEQKRIVTKIEKIMNSINTH